ncbi:MAG: homoserine kinase, partial [Erysipelotrichaceae bacterium]
MITVQVPATSANLGAGFDVLGLALQLYVKVTFTFIEKGIKISGCDEQYQNSSNLVYQAYALTMRHMMHSEDGIAIDIQSDIPIARGLGSSAALIIAGIVGANTLLNHPLSQTECLTLALELENHPDNLSAALLGGLVLSTIEDHQVLAYPFPVHSELRFLACIPPYESSTKKARSVLPPSVSYSDAVFNLSHLVLSMKALQSNDASLIKHAFQDRLHQPYRQVLIPEYASVSHVLKKYQSSCVVISGAGSTMLVISNNDQELKLILKELKAFLIDFTLLELEVDLKGVQV